jgi:predicted nucleotidyltransferase
MGIRINVPKEKIAEFCRKNRIRKLAFFGSVIRDDFRPDSDVDVLVEFEPDAKVGLDFFGMEIELSEMLGRKVDLNTRGFLSPYFRDEVIREAEAAYEQA